MRIAIDCADLDQSRIDGTRVYIKNVLDQLGQLAPADEFCLYHQRDFNNQLRPMLQPNYKDKKIPYAWWWTQTRLAYELRRDQPDVCWMPIQQMPYLALKETKFVVTIHDLAFKFFPEHFPWIDRFKLNLFADYAVKRADKIIAVSQSTKEDLIKVYPSLDPEKIEVIYHGFDKNAFAKRYDQDQISSSIRKYIPNFTLAEPYLLYVGAIQPRKDLVTLVKAFELIKTEGDFSKLKLILVGEPAWQAEKTLRYIQNSKFCSEIYLAGKVSFEDLSKFYQGAEIFVLPSLYEGFGIPVLEGFASQVPVVVADNSSLKEIGAAGVGRFKTGNSADLAAVLLRLLRNDKLKRELVARGSQRLAEFSWGKCAQETLELLHKVASQGS